jgi:hypothetical protein
MFGMASEHWPTWRTAKNASYHSTEHLRILPETSRQKWRELMIGIAKLWHSTDPHVWEQALDRYWDFVQPRNLDLERTLEGLDLKRIRSMDAKGWYEFLRDEYFRWKYTAANRYATTTKHLRTYEQEEGALDALHQIKERLLALDPIDIRLALSTASEIRGLGTAGASGLLALMILNLLQLWINLP